MDAGEEREKNEDFYGVLGLKKECTAAELRNAYKKLAMTWHPDRCSASNVEEAKKKFQAIQEAYSVLSDDNRRFLYDVGVYDGDDDKNGMSDFLDEMAVMMSQNKCKQENGGESFEDLQELFVEMFQSDLESFGSSSHNVNSSSCFTSYTCCCESSATNKRNLTEMNSGLSQNPSGFDAHVEGFCLGMGGTSGKWQDGERRMGRNSRSRRK